MTQESVPQAKKKEGQHAARGGKFPLVTLDLGGGGKKTCRKGGGVIQKTRAGGQEGSKRQAAGERRNTRVMAGGTCRDPRGSQGEVIRESLKTRWGESFHRLHLTVLQ